MIITIVLNIGPLETFGKALQLPSSNNRDTHSAEYGSTEYFNSL